MNHRELLQLLNRRGNEVKGMHLGLHRIVATMHMLGSPHRRAPVVHITGTNGKGSVAAMAESILRHSGLRTGLYTSPHLIRLEERIRVDGRAISARRLAARAGRVQEEERQLLERGAIDRPLTYFEFITACAFVHFAAERVDIAVVEVGLGGRLDATNVVEPRVCVITGISRDHQDLLGESLAAIAGEKAGIIKPGVPAVFACQSPTASKVIRGAARRCGAPLHEFGRDIRVLEACERRGRYTFDLQTPGGIYRNLRLALRGEHQVRNAALAVCAVEQLEDPRAGARAIRRGLARTVWPGRLDEYRVRRRTLLDGAHNSEGAAILREHLRRSGEEEIHLVFAALQGKEIGAMAARLFPLARSIHLARLANSRAASPEQVASLAKSGVRPQFHPSPAAALRAAWSACTRRGLVVVAGSLYLVGALLPLIRSEADSHRK